LKILKVEFTLWVGELPTDAVEALAGVVLEPADAGQVLLGLATPTPGARPGAAQVGAPQASPVEPRVGEIDAHQT
jgi:hypothetical protein